MRWPLLVVLVLACGCATPAAPSEDPAPPDEAVTYFGCRSLEIVSLLPAAQVAPLLPPGYSTDDPAPLVSLVGRCASGAHGGAPLPPDPTQGFVALQVRPPEELADGNVSIHVLTLRWVVASAAERAVFERWGLTVVEEARATFVLEERAADVASVAARTAGIANEALVGSPTPLEPYRVRFHDATGVPAFDAEVAGGASRDAAGTQRLEGTPLAGTHAGLAYARDEEGPFVTLRPVR